MVTTLAAKQDLLLLHRDLQSLRDEMRAEFRHLRREVDARFELQAQQISALHAETKASIAELQLKLTLRMGAMLVAVATVTVAVLQVL